VLGGISNIRKKSEKQVIIEINAYKFNYLQIVKIDEKGAFNGGGGAEAGPTQGHYTAPALATAPHQRTDDLSAPKTKKNRTPQTRESGLTNIRAT
jgi:hypothetical protein